MKIIAAILIFGVIIALHELGHFLSAKMCNVKINEFSIGMGPAIFKKQRGETLYSLRILPIGGYCAWEGEDEQSSNNRAFSNRPIWQQIFMLAAGAIMNLFLGLILSFTLIAMSSGNILTNTIAEVLPDSSAYQSGLRPGDTIKKINNMHIFVDNDIIYQLTNSPDGKLDMEVERDGQKLLLENISFLLTPATENTKQKIRVDFALLSENKRFDNMMEYSVKKSISTARLVWISTFDLIRGKYGFNELSGPVGIVETIGNIIDPSVTFKENLMMVINIAMFITINVGMFNLLPIPALDGCRILIRIGEGITHKKLDPNKEGIIHAVGLGLLMILMVVITFNDIVKLFKK